MIKKITKLLSLAVVMTIATFASLTHAQEETSTTLVTGPTFRSTLSGLAGGLDNIEKIQRVETLGDKTIEQIQLSGEIEVYARYDNHTIYYNTNANKIYLNPASNQMFSQFVNLKEIDLTQFDTSKVTDMKTMFNECRSLEELDLSSFDTRNVVNMRSMFNQTKKLTKLDLTSFDTRKVTDMRNMFYQSSVEELDLSSFDTSSVRNVSKMFFGAKGLKTVYASGSFIKTSITTDNDMFSGATNLEGGNGTKVSEMGIYDSTYAVIDKQGQPGYFTEKLDKTVLVPGTDFNIKIKQLATGGTVTVKEAQDAKIKHFREGNLSQKPNTGFVDIAVKGSMYSVDAWYDEDEETIYYYTEADEIYLNTDSSWMFYQRNAVEDIDTSKFNTSEVENMQGMFNKTYNLQELDLRGFNTDKVTSMQSMFNENKTLKELDLSSFVTSGVKTMEGMFNTCEGNNCSNLETVYVSSGFSTENLTTPTEGVFKGNNKLVGGNGTKFSGEYYDSTYARIDKEGQPGYFTDINNITVKYINIDDDGNETGQYITGVSKGDKVAGLTPSDIERKAGYSLKYYVDSGMETEFDFNQFITKYTQIYTKWEKQKSSGGNGGQSGGGGSHNNTPSDNDDKNSNQNQNQDNVTDTSGEKSQNTTGNNQPNNKSACASGDLMCNIHVWAYDNGLTKYNNIKNAKFDSLLKRQEMAKISSIFATKFYGKRPDESKKEFCSQYADLNSVNNDMKHYIIQSCELGLMGYKANGTDTLEKFRPYSPVSLAELSIIISRIMWGNTYALGEKQWYQGHLRATYEAGILDNIDNPSKKITRGETFEMFYKSLK